MTVRTTIIISDCRDGNAVARQVSRAQSLMNCSAGFVGVTSDLEAAGNLIDVLDAVQDESTVVLVNVAPRNGKAKKWPNGTPFGYFRYQNTLIVASVDGLTLSLVKKLKLTDTIHVMDIPTCIKIMAEHKDYSQGLQDYIINTQFRSFEFVPRVAAFLCEHGEITSEPLSIQEIPDAPKAVWWVDNFGNCKTTLLKGDDTDEIIVEYKLGSFERLKDIPDNELAMIIGSSGLGKNRFLEISQQGASASKTLNLVSGSCF